MAQRVPRPEKRASSRKPGLSKAEIKELNRVSAWALEMIARLPVPAELQKPLALQVAEAHRAPLYFSRSQKQVQLQIVDGVLLATGQLEIQLGYLRKSIPQTMQGALPIVAAQLDDFRKSFLALLVSKTFNAQKVSLAVDRCVEIEAALAALTEYLKEKRGFGNPRHHLIGGIIAAAIAIGAIPLTVAYEAGYRPHLFATADAATSLAAPQKAIAQPQNPAFCISRPADSINSVGQRLKKIVMKPKSAHHRARSPKRAPSVEACKVPEHIG